MSGNQKISLVPKLRFPEFRDTEGWSQQQLSSVATFFKGKGLPKSALILDGKNPCIHYGELFTFYSEVIDTVRSRTNSENDIFLSIENDVLMPTSDVTPNGLAKACCINLENIILGGDILVIRTDKRSINGEFLARYIRHLEHKVLQLVSGSTVFHLYASSMEKLALSFPPERTEQQKIADCLGSLDELIAAQAQQVEALKIHKKGLMQQLFPRAGETQPRLRFPEFQNAGEWSEEKLDDLVHFQDGFAFKSTDFVKAHEDATQVIRITDINNKNTNEEKVYIPSAFLEANNLGKYGVDDGDLLLSLTGAAGFNFFFWDGGPATINQRTAKVTAKKKANRALLRLLEPLIHEKINARGEGQNNNLSKEFLSAIILLIPEPDEQQRIASCLSSLDTLITLETQKLEALKTHKKGLMQQIFPSPESES